jgi:hypothetical protein
MRLFTHRALAPIVGVTLAGGLAPAADAGFIPIDDKSYFDPFDATVLSFETDGSGAPVERAGGGQLLPGERKTLPAAEYAGQGVLFNKDIDWVHDGSAAFQAALTMGGSPVLGIPSDNHSTFAAEFPTPAQAVGVFAVWNADLGDAAPLMRAYDADDNLIDTVTLTGSLVDGSFGPPMTNFVVEFGFMGIEHAAGISRVEFEHSAGLFDDLTFTLIPTPASAALLLGGLGLAARRRR